MKKLLLTNLLFLLCLNALAQNEKSKNNPTDKGSFVVDGSVYFSAINSTSTRGDYKNNVINIEVSPKVAFFVIDRLALGLETSYYFARNKSTNLESESSSTSNYYGISISPYLKYYFINRIFLQASAGFGTSKSKDSNTESKGNTFNSQIGIGYAFFLNNNISFEPMISYRYNESKTNGSDDKSFYKVLMLGAGLTIFL